MQVTRNYPPVGGQDSTDHDTIHPGLWLAFGDISGADFWRNKGVVRHAEFIVEPAVHEGVGTFVVRNEYLAMGKTLCEEDCRIRIVPRTTSTLIIWDSQFGGENDFSFGDQEEMGLGFRVATPLAVKNGGRIVNSDGLVDEKQAWGKQADWCDYSGTVDGRQVGLLLVPDPRNFRRSWFHARDYGVLVANPFGQNAFTKGPKSEVIVREGELLRLRFGVLVHAGPIDLAAAYRETLEALKAHE